MRIPAEHYNMIVPTIYAIAAGVIISFWMCVLDSSLFAWHPTFMTLGFLGFMTLGVVRSITFRKLDGSPRVKAIQIHALFQASAVLCITLGLAAVVTNKVDQRLAGSGCGHYDPRQTPDPKWLLRLCRSYITSLIFTHCIQRCAACIICKQTATRTYITQSFTS